MWLVLGKDFKETFDFATYFGYFGGWFNQVEL